ERFLLLWELPSQDVSQQYAQMEAEFERSCSNRAVKSHRNWKRNCAFDRPIVEALFMASTVGRVRYISILCDYFARAAPPVVLIFGVNNMVKTLNCGSMSLRFAKYRRMVLMAFCLYCAASALPAKADPVQFSVPDNAFPIGVWMQLTGNAVKYKE